MLVLEDCCITANRKEYGNHVILFNVDTTVVNAVAHVIGGIPGVDTSRGRYPSATTSVNGLNFMRISTSWRVSAQRGIARALFSIK